MATLPVWWHLLLPDPPDGVPGNLTQRDRDKIARLCRFHTLGWVGDRVRRGEFISVSFGAGRLFRQKIHRLIDDRDGTYRVYVVVYDKSDPYGYVPWSRHQMSFVAVAGLGGVAIAFRVLWGMISAFIG